MIIREGPYFGGQIFCARHVVLIDPHKSLDERGIPCAIIQLHQRTTLWLSIASKHFASFSMSEFESPSEESPGEGVNPCATSWELMYCRLDVDAAESEDDASEYGDPKSEMETSRAQCTSFCGRAAIAIVGCWGSGVELEGVVVVVVDVEGASSF